MKRKEQKVSTVHDMEHIPAGYVPLGTIATDSGATPLYGYVDRAIDRGELTRSLFKCKGRKFLHLEDLNRLTEEFNSRGAPSQVEAPTKPTYASGISSRQVESAVIALCEINNGITLMQATLERLTSAVEGIATQPKDRFEDATEASWNGMNGQSH